jgi:hypothetical protein
MPARRLAEDLTLGQTRENEHQPLHPTHGTKGMVLGIRAIACRPAARPSVPYSDGGHVH